jgi:hypothetical protein
VESHGRSDRHLLQEGGVPVVKCSVRVKTLERLEISVSDSGSEITTF